jgi:transposase
MLEELVMEASAAPAVPEASARDAEPSSPAVKAKRSARKPPPEHLPRREVLHEPSCTCPSCGRRDAQGRRRRDRDPLVSSLVEAVAQHVMAAEKLHADDTPVRRNVGLTNP